MRESRNPLKRDFVYRVCGLCGLFYRAMAAGPFSNVTLFLKNVMINLMMNCLKTEPRSGGGGSSSVPTRGPPRMATADVILVRIFFKKLKVRLRNPASWRGHATCLKLGVL